MKKLMSLVFAALITLAAPSYAQKTELTFYYPIAVGGPLTKVIDGFVAALEKAPATWAEMEKAAAKLVKKDAGGNIARWGVSVPSTGYAYWMFQAFARENGQDLMNKDGNQTNFAHPDVVAALQYWRDLGAKAKVMPEGTVEWGTLRQAFTEGKTAMMWHTTGNLTAVKDNAKFPFGVAMLPASKQRGSPTGGGNWYIFKKTTPEERKAAFQFVQWITAPERTAEWSIATGYVGTRPDAYDTPKLKEYVSGFPQAAVARDQLKFATPELSTFQTGRVRKALDDAIQAALTGGKAPADALKAAQQEAERLLKSYR